MMTEERVCCSVQTLLRPQIDRANMSTEHDTMRAELEELERRLIPLLVTVQRALGKEPDIKTRAERRRG